MFIAEILANQIIKGNEFFGVNIGFWVAMGVVVVIALFQNIFFWTRKKYYPESPPKLKNAKKNKKERK